MSSRGSKILTVFLGNSFHTLVLFLLIPYLARALTKFDYGSYHQILMCYELILLLFAIGLAKIIFVSYARHQDEQGTVLGSNLWLGAISGATGMGLLFLGAPMIATLFENPSLISGLRILSVSILFQVLYHTLDATLIYFGKVRESVGISISTNLLKIALIVLVVKYCYSLDSLILAHTVLAFLQLLLAVIFTPSILWKTMGKSKQLLKEQWSEGLPLGLSSLTNFLLIKTDGIMISVLLLPVDFALFRNGAFQVPFLSTFAYAISSIILPELANLFIDGKKKEITLLKKRIISNSAAVMYPVVAFALVFHYPLIVWFLSEQYKESAIIFFIYNLLLLIRINFYQDILTVAGKTKEIFRYFLLGQVLNIALNYILITQIGIAGAAIASVFCTYLVMGMLLVSSFRELDIKANQMIEFRKISIILLLSVLVSGAAYLLYMQFQQLWMIPLLMVLSVLICYFVFIRKNWLEESVVRTVAENASVFRPIIDGFVRMASRK